MKVKIVVSFLSCLVALTTLAQIKDIPFGDNSHIRYDLRKGTYDVIFKGRTVIKDAYAVCRSGDRADSSISYTFHRWTTFPRGEGEMVYMVQSSGGGRPVMDQRFYIRKGEKVFTTSVRIEATGCNYMSPLTTQHAYLDASDEDRALLVPFDNDAWVRYNAFPLGLADFTSAEVTALYNNASRSGLVLGALMQLTWKTGITIKGADSGKITQLSAFGGYTDKTYTHDLIGHGTVMAEPDHFCTSPVIMVGWYDDWRAGLEDYATHARMRQVPRWSNATTFGWNSWGAMQDKLTLPKAKAVVDFFHDSCSNFRTADNTLYIDLDSYWDMLLQGGLEGDYSRLKEFCDYCKSKGFQPGIYWAPFVDWGKSPRKMEGSDYNYADCWVRQNGNYNDLDGARALDPTHPGTLARIALVIRHFKACGFRMIKIDFLGHAALEADQFYDKSVHTGMQAFREGMEFLAGQLEGKMLMYAAISPNLATARFVHMRRIACDAYSGINETAYTLNSTTYGWWQDKLYDYVDADHIVFKAEPPGVNRARLASALITGTLITGDDYSTPGNWHSTAKILLQNKDLVEVARAGRAFRPVEGNTGDQAGNFFVRREGKHTSIAIFNYSDKVLHYTIDPIRWGISKKPLKELFSGAVLQPGMLTISVPPADAVIYRQD
ncbi:hypothetical protein Q4E93_10435 [Flavitalea sp. BT771]|uniref:hypothetical protein n=1 Tax=Flavitalea sp. BT771 TaxID=3063329 RepID=UPI0026E136F9|nr:hypothetical protein [Flavitalea sp. BT771]MDO6431006.1 hypothetical protein [Flavitalea sp. BT771]MDV6219913.1 hypothetical protein [Flavitalea sp. BT771]